MFLDSTSISIMLRRSQEKQEERSARYAEWIMGVCLVVGLTLFGLVW